MFYLYIYQIIILFHIIFEINLDTAALNFMYSLICACFIAKNCSNLNYIVSLQLTLIQKFKVAILV